MILRNWIGNDISWFDNENKPLIGRITFYKYRTSEVASIYKINKYVHQIPLANPVFTNTTGQAIDDVYLENDKNYTIMFEKYIGNGEMSSDTDPSNWLFQYSNDNLAPLLNVDLEGIPCVNTVNDLYSFGDISTREGDLVALLGYYSAYDKPLVYYRARINSGLADNGGSILDNEYISENKVIVWEMLPVDSNYLDVRHFGVFPNDDGTLANTSQLIRADSYARSLGLTLYFAPTGSGNNVYGIYWFQNNSFTLGRTYISDAVVLNFQSNCSVSITMAEEQTISNGGIVSNSATNSITINGEKLNTYLLGGNNPTAANYINCSLFPTETLIVDSNPGTVTVSNINVFVKNSQAHLNLTNCTIFSTTMINAGITHTFNNCRLTENMFSNLTFANIQSNLTLSNLKVYINDFNSPAMFFAIAYKGGQYEIDFGGKTLNTSYVHQLTRTVKLSNIATFSTGSIKYNCQNTTMEIVLENITFGTGNIKPIAYNKTNTNHTTIKIHNCTFNSGNASEFIPQTLYIDNTRINSGSTAINANKLYASDVYFGSAYVSCGFDSEIYNCYFGTHMDVRPNTSKDYEAVNDWNIEQKYSYSITIEGCTFEDTSNAYVYFVPYLWNDSVIGDGEGYISKYVRLSNNKVLKYDYNTTPNQISDITYKWIQFTSGKLSSYAGDYYYENNINDGHSDVIRRKMCSFQLYKSFICIWSLFLLSRQRWTKNSFIV